MFEVIFYLLMSALFFLGLVAASALLFLPFVRFFDQSNDDAGNGNGCITF